MARTRLWNTGNEISNEDLQTPIISPSGLLSSFGSNCLGDTLKNDSIDLGEAGRINYRTGSFLGRFIEHPMDPTKSRKNDSSLKSRSGQTLNDYLHSGHLDGVVLPTDNNNTNQQLMNRNTPNKPLIPKVPIEPSKTDELDPVLALLQSDVSQLDELRSNFREKSALYQYHISYFQSFIYTYLQTYNLCGIF